jgi:hypothetical protein
VPGRGLLYLLGARFVPLDFWTFDRLACGFDVLGLFGFLGLVVWNVQLGLLPVSFKLLL